MSNGSFLILFQECNLIVTFQVNPLTTNVLDHIESSQLICSANQLTGFYMMENIGIESSQLICSANQLAGFYMMENIGS